MREITTARLYLQPVQAGDLDELYALSSVPEVNLHNPAGLDRDITQTHERLNDWITDWAQWYRLPHRPGCLDGQIRGLPRPHRAVVPRGRRSQLCVADPPRFSG